MFTLFQLLKQKFSAASPMATVTSQSTITPKKYAVVTGGNKGIGLEICRQLASKGVSVVLTARNEKRGIEAVDKLKKSGLSDNVMFHQLDILDSRSCSALAEFIKSQIGKLDILVNNAGIGEHSAKKGYELAVDVLQTNYYGAKRTTEALLPVLQLSNSPRIVNVSSTMGTLSSISNKWAKGVLSDAQNLTEEKIDEVLNEFLKDVKEGNPQAKGWPGYWSAYCVSKAAMNAYTRILAKKYPSMRINSVCPGWVKTELGNNSGILSTEEGAKSPVRLALLDDGPSGLFFDRMRASSF
ncbi:hypothetical protein RD792_010646 [Penstemon davidsonii]|uniref:Short-chain dehydrogenase/reductase n=1 Tax=Penstemon davidsonii TaxID=160366 RepID=A0ABR0D2E9_9LAMI|nr:hypothetical protein RD792_010646 [Penstemon davidsonii]